MWTPRCAHSKPTRPWASILGGAESYSILHSYRPDRGVNCTNLKIRGHAYVGESFQYGDGRYCGVVSGAMRCEPGCSPLGPALTRSAGAPGQSFARVP